MDTNEPPKIESLFTLFEESSLSEFELTTERYTVKMKRAANAGAVVTESEVKSVESPAEVEVITSPIVGTFYLTPAPDAPPYVGIGSKVEAGDVLCTIEAMKLMNQLEAEFPCQIVRILAKPETMVEFGFPLFEVKRL